MASICSKYSFPRLRQPLTDHIPLAEYVLGFDPTVLSGLRLQLTSRLVIIHISEDCACFGWGLDGSMKLPSLDDQNLKRKCLMGAFDQNIKAVRKESAPRRSPQTIHLPLHRQG
jgi:hypothetical protein